MNPPPRLSGKLAVVTGGGSGIGAAIVDCLTREGASCYAVGRRGPTAVDVTDADAVAKFVEALPRIDILVCAAGDNIPDRRLDQLTSIVWDQMIAVNLSGAFYFISAALPKLLAARGDVLLISSVSSAWPDMSGPAYQAAKAGLTAFARAAGFEHHLNGLRFSVISPGLTNTPFLQKRPEPPPPELAAAMLHPEDVAETCVFLLTLPRRAHIPELVILPTQLQALGKTAAANPRASDSAT